MTKGHSAMPGWSSALCALRHNLRGVALIEFAYSLPLLVALGVTGAELTNYVTVKMRVSQVALHLADHSSRAGVGDPLQPKQLREVDINDVLTGAGLQAGELDFYNKGRVIISSLEPVASPNKTNKYKIAWQRCRGSKAYASTYGKEGDTNLAGIGPAGRQVGAPDDGGTMFVEVSYTYQPLIAARFVPAIDMTAIAAMTVRDRRDFNGGIYNNEKVPKSSC